ncbi:hypothetical protein HGO37_25980 [Rhizobium sp. CG4]|uniref:hypothetical protein n=1 Tax=Rhizobium sp. CG4 TaxID=2726075 RepID=UPI0020348DD1|nr:hypothetical protein [Rhizobium sp. CG4]MCM2458837.1 hypothetical protein [Rhizobium sp. CG4]
MQVAWYCNEPSSECNDRYSPLASSFTAELATIHTYPDLETFNVDLIAKFGAGIDEELFTYLTTCSKEVILASADQIASMLPYDPALPQTEALEARFPLADHIYTMDLTLYDSCSNEFILGSNPLPNKDLGLGFSVPLSKNVALLCSPPANQTSPVRARKTAALLDVEVVNLEQLSRAEEAIASSKVNLEYWVNQLDSQ